MKSHKKISLLILFGILTAFLLFPMTVDAKKVTADKNVKKCAQIKTGKNQVTSAKCVSEKRLFVKFTAPKESTYRFRFSNFRTKKKGTDSCMGTGKINLCKRDKYGYMADLEVEQPLDGVTQARGKTPNIMICTQMEFDMKGPTAEKGMYNPVPERFVYKKFKKGETVYLAFDYAGTYKVDITIDRFFGTQY